MSFLPIVERELRVAARRTAVYRIRTVVAVLTVVISMFFLIAARVSGSTRLGGQIFETLVLLACFYCLFEALRGADSLSEEKREGTLGLLFLTNLRGYDVILGKLVGIGVRSFHGLLAFLPVLALALIIGGVTAGEFWRSALALLNTLFFSLAVALCVSSLSRQAHHALGGTVLVLVLMALGPRLAQSGPAMPGLSQSIRSSMVVLSPVTSIRHAQDVLYRGAPGKFWVSLAAIHCLSWVALAAAAAIAQSSAQERESHRLVILGKRLWAGWRTGGTDSRTTRRWELLEMNPFFWLVARHRRDSLFIASLFGAILSLGLVGWFMRSPQFVGACSVVSMILLLAWVAWRSVQAFGEARQSGALEQLLATPLPVQEMLVGHWLGLKHLFVLPVGFALLLRVMAHLMPALQTAPALPIHRGLLLYLGVGYDALSFLVSLIAIFWLGLWLGLRRRKLPQAFLYTILFGLVLPTFVVCIPNVAIHLGLMGWARTRLLRDFRRVASGENSAHRQHIIRPHLLPNSNVPPVILQR